MEYGLTHPYHPSCTGALAGGGYFWWWYEVTVGAEV